MTSSPINVLILGAGSAGRRHARNLSNAGASVSVMDPDINRARLISGAETLPFDMERIDGFEGIVVASPNVFHGEQALAALNTDARVLVEKPLAVEVDELDAMLEKGSERLMVGYNLRLHEPVQRLVTQVHQGRVGKPLIVRVWFGSYLPAWRPQLDYRATYSARRELGGGVLLDAIHELDLLIWLVDERLEVLAATVDRIGDLEIDVEDVVMALLRHADGAVIEVSLDYLSRRYRRGVEVVGEEGTIRLDWARQVLELEHNSKVQIEEASKSIDDSYEREAEIFLAWIRGEAEPPVNAAVGSKSVRLAHQIRATAR